MQGLEKLIEIITTQSTEQAKQSTEQAKQSAETNKRIDALCEKVGSSNEIMVGVLAKMDAQSNSLERFEKNQMALGKEVKRYHGKNDDRVMVLEKVVLGLEFKDKDHADKWEKVDKTKWTIGTALLVAAVLAYFGLS